MTPGASGRERHGAPPRRAHSPIPRGTVLGVVRAGLVLASLLVLVFAGCGGGEGGRTPSSAEKNPPKTGSPSPARYTPGDPQCDARRRPGTVGDIGEDVVGLNTPVRSFVACYGPPVGEKRKGSERCLYYRQRGGRTYWELCARQGRIESGRGSLREPRAP